jgi:hypothetical protein
VSNVDDNLTLFGRCGGIEKRDCFVAVERLDGAVATASSVVESRVWAVWVDSA